MARLIYEAFRGRGFLVFSRFFEVFLGGFFEGFCLLHVSSIGPVVYGWVDLE